MELPPYALCQDQAWNLVIRNLPGMIAAFSSLMPGDMPLIFPVALGSLAAMKAEINSRLSFWKAKEAAKSSILAASVGGEGKDSVAGGQTRQIEKQAGLP